MTGNHDNMYKVPQGYFENLNSRLSMIPAMEQMEEQAVTPWTRLRPVVALAASIAALVVCGSAVLNFTSGKGGAASDTDYFEYAYYMIPETDPYSLYDETLAETLAPSVSEEDLINYLIETGVSVEQLGYANYDE